MKQLAESVLAAAQRMVTGAHHKPKGEQPSSNVAFRDCATMLVMCVEGDRGNDA